MPKRFAFVCAILLLLNTSAHAQPQNPSPSSPPTLWDHNGSVVYLVANGSSREFYYQKPRPGMVAVGARPGSLLFRGQINDGQYSGTAYIFNPRCGPIPFQVKGPVLDNADRIVFTGQAPRVRPKLSHPRILYKQFGTPTIRIKRDSASPSTIHGGSDASRGRTQNLRCDRRMVVNHLTRQHHHLRQMKLRRQQRIHRVTPLIPRCLALQQHCHPAKMKLSQKESTWTTIYGEQYSPW